MHTSSRITNLTTLLCTVCNRDYSVGTVSTHKIQELKKKVKTHDIDTTGTTGTNKYKQNVLLVSMIYNTTQHNTTQYNDDNHNNNNNNKQ